MGKKLDIKSGDRFGRYIAIMEMPRQNNSRRFHCRCDCGTEKTLYLKSLTDGNRNSCGCLRSEVNRIVHTKHGQARDTGVGPEYSSWISLKNRCLNPNSPSYPDYGRRGITVCLRWLDSFENFRSDMGPRPSKKHSIGRIDNNGNYEPDNCRWETQTQQSRNTRSNVFVTLNGKTLCVKDWARLFEISLSTVYSRMSRGWEAPLALTTPVRRREHHHGYR